MNCQIDNESYKKDHRYELKIEDKNIVKNFSNDSNFILYLFSNPASYDGNDKFINKFIKNKPPGNVVICNISSKIELSNFDQDVFNQQNLNIIKKYVDDPKCEKIILMCGEDLIKIYKNIFTKYFKQIEQNLELQRDKVFCSNLTKKYNLPLFGRYNIFDRDLILYFDLKEILKK